MRVAVAVEPLIDVAHHRLHHRGGQPAAAFQALGNQRHMPLQPAVLAGVEKLHLKKIPGQQRLAQVVHQAGGGQRLAQLMGHFFPSGEIQQVGRYTQGVPHQQRLLIQALHREQQRFTVFLLQRQQAVRMARQLHRVHHAALAQRQYLVVQIGGGGRQPAGHGGGVIVRLAAAHAAVLFVFVALEQLRRRQRRARVARHARRLTLDLADHEPQAPVVLGAALGEHKPHFDQAPLRVRLLVARAATHQEPGAVGEKQLQLEHRRVGHQRGHGAGRQLHQTALQGQIAQIALGGQAAFPVTQHHAHLHAQPQLGTEGIAALQNLHLRRVIATAQHPVVTLETHVRA